MFSVVIAGAAEFSLCFRSCNRNLRSSSHVILRNKQKITAQKIIRLIYEADYWFSREIYSSRLYQFGVIKNL